MFATLADEPFSNKDWIYEIKWDGYRAVADVNNSKVNLSSRKMISFNEKYHPIVTALSGLSVNAVLDGEIVCIDENGKANFQQLQQWQKTAEGNLVYYVFDLLWVDGYSIMDLPLVKRKEILKAILPENDTIRYSDHIEENGLDFFSMAVREGMEGIMAKQADSNYTPGFRTRQWLKIKSNQRQEAVIAGFTEARGSRSHFGALVLGVYENGELVYAGHTGSGFNQKGLADMYKKLKALVIPKPPFKKKPKTNMPCTWVKPKLVCEIKFAEWTKDNIMRQPIFVGLREDKDAKEVVREKSAHVKTIEPESTTNNESDMKTKTATKAKKKVPAKKAAPAKKTTAARKLPAGDLLNATEKEQVVTVNKKELTFTNLDKLYWPKEKYTKRDLLNYYHQIAPYILPYMENRPQSLNRLPNGITKPGFYQKDVTGKVPDWATTHDYVAESDGEKKEYFVCTDEADLLYMANLGCIEMNPWHSTTQKPGNPTWCVIDLDPGKISFEKVIETAQVIKKVTDSIGIETYCKTSGSTGLHIYIPLGAAYSYDQSRQLAELIVTFVHQEIPSFTSLERSPAKRKTKIYLDYLQNRTIQTIAAPYSVRPKPGATVSTPLYWEEVKKGLQIADFNIHNIFNRLKETGDIFKPVLGKGIDIKKAIENMNSL